MNQIPLRRNRDFVLLQVGQGLSTLGSQSSALAYPLLVLALTHSPAKAGLVGFARVVPYPLFGISAGVLVDRFERKRLMLFSDSVRAAALASLVIALAVDELRFVQIAIVAFVEGVMFVLFNVAEIAALRSVVPPQQMAAAAAGEQARLSIVEAGGPPVGGVLFGLGRAVPFLFDACSYAFSMISLLAIRSRFREERTNEPDVRLSSQFAEGFRWLWNQRFLRACALLFAGTNFVFEALFLTLIIVGRAHGLSGFEIGVLVAALGGCALGGAAMATRLHGRLSMRALVLVLFWSQFAVAGFLIKPSVYVLVAGLIPNALINPAVNAAVIGYRVAVVPDRLTGRVNSIARTVALTASPLGPLAAGVLLASMSARSTVAVLVGIIIALALVATVSGAIREAPSLAELASLRRSEDRLLLDPTGS
jgi:MFS family permease